MLRLLPTNQIWRYWSFATFCHDVAAAGALDVDIWLCNNHVNIDAWDVYNLDEVVSSCTESGLRVRTLTPEQSNPKAYNLASLDRATQQLTLGYYRNIVKLGQVLGAKRISINGGWTPLDSDRQKARGALVLAVRRICDMAADAGMTVSIEPLVRRPYRLVSSLEDVAGIVSEVGRTSLTVTLDTGTIARNGESLATWLDAFGSDIGYVHLTNLDPRDPAHVGWGDQAGALNPVEILNQLKAGGYSGDCALEMTKSSYFEHPYAVLTSSLTTLKGREY